jgi:hypothetical protein
VAVLIVMLRKGSAGVRWVLFGCALAAVLGGMFWFLGQGKFDWRGFVELVVAAPILGGMAYVRWRIKGGAPD